MVMSGVAAATQNGVKQLDTIVLRRFVTGSNHNTNPLSTVLLGAKTSEQAHGKDDCVEDVTGDMRWSKCKQMAIAGYMWRRG